jgi:hypothetical protein
MLPEIVLDSWQVHLRKTVVGVIHELPLPLFFAVNDISIADL